MILIDDLEHVILDLVCLELKVEHKTLPKFQKVSDEILFNFRHSKLLRLSANWLHKHNDGSREYKLLEKSVFFEEKLRKSVL